MKYLLCAVAASGLMAGTAFAGNIQPAPMEPVIAPAPARVAVSPNWTGFYAGGQLGYAHVDLSTPVGDFDDNGLIGGLIAGYDYDLGDWVIGAGFDYDWADVSFNNGAAEIDSLWRAKLRGGHKIGNGLLYATAGYAQGEASTRSASDDTGGYFVGGGYEHLVTENISLGGEVLYHDFDAPSGYSIDGTTAQVRAAFRF